MKQFDIPEYFKSPVISRVKKARKEADPRKKDFSPSILDFGPVQFYLARHFGFCYGVENAIEISYKTVEENPGKRVFLLSEMIHNPVVNEGLTQRGVRFLMDTSGKQLIPFSELTSADIVITPAFGTTLEIQHELETRGIQLAQYDTTCPFVEKVWKRAGELGADTHTVVVHGKPNHEETRATFSHSSKGAPTVVVRDMQQTEQLADVILGKKSAADFYEIFRGQHSEGFDPEKDLGRIGVVNQTTMLASDTQAIADFLRETMVRKYGEAEIKNHFADTRDTLCYATNDNQKSTLALLEEPADLAVIVGGYNSSNTSHLVELCETKFPSFFISGPDKILSAASVDHFDLHSHSEVRSHTFLPAHSPVRIILTSGASCPDALLDAVLQKILGYFENVRELDAVLPPTS